MNVLYTIDVLLFESFDSYCIIGNDNEGEKGALKDKMDWHICLVFLFSQHWIYKCIFESNHNGSKHGENQIEALREQLVLDESKMKFLGL